MGRCSQAACEEPGTCWPTFVLSLRSGGPPRRIAVPLEVCAAHGALIAAAFASPERRAALARACGQAALDIDWGRCRLELAPSSLGAPRAAAEPRA